jgi:hypothetical protein
VTAKTWDYDGSIHRFPLQPGELWSCQSGPSATGRVMVNDLYRGLPDFMAAADCLFVDPPWNRSNENSFRTKARGHGVRGRSVSFTGFLDALFRGIERIAPQTCFIEMGFENAASIRSRLEARWPHVQVWPVTYYRRQPCLLLRGGAAPSAVDYARLDELEAIALICRSEPFQVIGDICMGRGTVGIEAFKRRRAFVGTELNPARLAVMVNRIHSLGGEWQRDGIRYVPQPGEPGAVGAGREGLRERL